MAWSRGIPALIVAITFGVGNTWTTFAQGPKPESPPPSVILAKTVRGHLIRIERESYVLKDDRGEEVRIEVGRDTLLDKTVAVGDLIEAEVSPDGHARSIVKARQ
ncbi:MAG: hypothetical protein AB1411_13170 [Nitrospirota bacterium]